MHSATIFMDEFIQSQSLVTRQAARDVFEKISASRESQINLDFTGISFASRSFFDELNNFQSKFKLLGKQVELLNLNETLSSLLEIVQSSAQMKSSMSYASTTYAETITF